MHLLFLGTSSGAPTTTRNVAGLAFRGEQASKWWLFDCGEATQHQILRTPLSLVRLERIFLSHLHGDHCFGLPGLLSSRGMAGGTEPLDIYGPVGTQAFARLLEQTSRAPLPYPLRIHEIQEPGVLVDEEDVRVHTDAVRHVGSCWGYVIEEKERAGRFRVEQAQAMGLSPGPLYGRLKRGEIVVLDDGRKVDGKDLLDPPKPGRKLVIPGDTFDASSLLEVGHGAEALVHEATFLEATDRDLASQYYHSTAADAGRFAHRLGAKCLILTHFSPRYDSTEGMSALQQEARAHFPEGTIYLAHDFFSLTIIST